MLLLTKLLRGMRPDTKCNDFLNLQTLSNLEAIGQETC